MALALAMILCLTACGGSTKATDPVETKPASAETPEVIPDAPADDWEGITLKLSHNLQSTDLLNTTLTDVVANISERTNGKVNIELYPNGELLTYADAVEAIQADSNVIYFCAFGDWVDFWPDAYSMCSAFEFDSVEQYQRFMETEEFAAAADKLAEQGIYLLQGGWIAGFRHVLTNKTVNSMADLSGLTIRTPAVGYFTEAFTDLGMSPVGMAWTETLTAASTGSIDSVEATYSTITTNNLWDYYTDITETKHIIQADNLWMSTDVWNSIPEEYQTIIKEEMLAGEKLYCEGSAAAEEVMRQTCLDHGMKINTTIDLTEFVDACKDNIYQYEGGKEIVEVLEGLK